MRGKTKVVKSGNVILGIITEIVMTVMMMAIALGFAWIVIEVIT